MRCLHNYRGARSPTPELHLAQTTRSTSRTSWQPCITVWTQRAQRSTWGHIAEVQPSTTRDTPTWEQDIAPAMAAGEGFPPERGGCICAEGGLYLRDVAVVVDELQGGFVQRQAARQARLGVVWEEHVLGEDLLESKHRGHLRFADAGVELPLHRSAPLTARHACGARATTGRGGRRNLVGVRRHACMHAQRGCGVVDAEGGQQRGHAARTRLRARRAGVGCRCCGAPSLLGLGEVNEATVFSEAFLACGGPACKRRRWGHSQRGTPSGVTAPARHVRDRAVCVIRTHGVHKRGCVVCLGHITRGRCRHIALVTRVVGDQEIWATRQVQAGVDDCTGGGLHGERRVRREAAEPRGSRHTGSRHTDQPRTAPGACVQAHRRRWCLHAQRTAAAGGAARVRLQCEAARCVVSSPRCATAGEVATHLAAPHAAVGALSELLVLPKGHADIRRARVKQLGPELPDDGADACVEAAGFTWRLCRWRGLDLQTRDAVAGGNGAECGRHAPVCCVARRIVGSLLGLCVVGPRHGLPVGSAAELLASRGGVSGSRDVGGGPPTHTGARWW